MYCISCGTPAPDEATFCVRCGKQLYVSSTEHSGPPGASSSSAEETVLSLSSASWRRDLHLSARWMRRIGIPLATAAWIGLIAAVLWAAAHVARSLVLLAIAAILAFALAPLVKLMQRVMPRILAILIVYVIVMGGISVVLSFLLRAAILEAEDLSRQASGLFQSGQASPLTSFLASLGIDPTQLQNVRQSVTGQLGGLVGDLVPVLRSIFDMVVDVIVVAMLSIYLLIDGSRAFGWLRTNMPARFQKRGSFLLDTLQTVVGGYIRGQLTLSLLIGVLVGAGMAVLRVPHPVLLGELAFLLAFIPMLGTFISGALCILLSLTASASWVVALTGQTWILAIIVLLYFVSMHFIESHIVGPRVVGHAVGLHPIISIAALVAGTELFGILGALFVVPFVGMIQVVIAGLWREWRAQHPDQFPAT